MFGHTKLLFKLNEAMFKTSFPSSRSALLGLVISLLALPATIQAQVRLSEPEVVFPEDFGAIQTVRALADGKVLVADPLGKALYLVDLEAGTRTVVGREGQGPDEYLQPDAVWALPADSTLLVDLGNGRLATLGPDLSFGETQPIALGEPRMGQPLVLAIPQAVDGAGHLYTRVMGSMGGAFPDSADVVRIDRGTRSYTPVAKIKLGEMTRTTSGGANNQNVSITPVPLSPEDAWGVASDGSVVVVRSGDYHVEWIHPDGRVTRGAPVSFQPIRIRQAEKEEYVAEQARSGGGIRVGVTVENGQMSMQFSRGGETEARAIDQYPWPEAKPPFYALRIPVDPMGRAWVKRHVEAGEESTYDVFGPDGDRLNSVLLPHGERVLGFGAGSLFAVAFDEFDLSFLKRYPMPRF